MARWWEVAVIGKLNFTCRIMGRILCLRLSLATSGISAQRHYICLTMELLADLRIWDTFLESYNGRSLWMMGSVSNADLVLFMDAAGSIGYGAYFQGHWSAELWLDECRSAGLLRILVLLELSPIVLAVEFWGEAF